MDVFTSIKRWNVLAYVQRICVPVEQQCLLVRSGLIRDKCLDDSLFGILADTYSPLVVEGCCRFPLSSQAAAVGAAGATCRMVITENFLYIWAEMGSTREVVCLNQFHQRVLGNEKQFELATFCCLFSRLLDQTNFYMSIGKQRTGCPPGVIFGATPSMRGPAWN